ncbi:hypothetical protein XENTR_v10005913 [Xenopus tropicalis]|nr:hypothetical protein XENTR_v10005913 [Xenopus tropicalis]
MPLDHQTRQLPRLGFLTMPWSYAVTSWPFPNIEQEGLCKIQEVSTSSMFYWLKYRDETTFRNINTSATL